jgi:pyridine nucleotide-disulfide oxidoreductase family protein
MKHLVLVGGGHSHLLVLEHLAKIARNNAFNKVKVTLISPSRWQEYSGMLPGWLAGIYQQEECRIDLVPLAQQANIDFVEGSVIGMDADRSCVCLSNGTHISYDVVSLDIGSEIDLEWLQALGNKVIPVRPIADFHTSWQSILNNCRNKINFTLAIVGGGAAGVEVALAVAQLTNLLTTKATVVLVAGFNGVLPNHATQVQTAALKALANANVNVINERAAGTTHSLLMSDGRELGVDSVIATTGSKPALWLTLSKLKLDDEGYVLVDAHHRSLSHTNVFAAGNICARTDVKLPRSGVHAVSVGPILAHNLVASLMQKSLKTYQPKQTSLYLLSCSNGRAIVSWGNWSAEGRWVWWWKDWIDRHFIKRFSLKSE